MLSAFRIWFELAKADQDEILVLLRGRINWEAYEDAEPSDEFVDETVLRIDKPKKKKLPYHNTRGGRATTGGHDSQTGSTRIGSGQRIGQMSQIGSWGSTRIR